MAKRQLYQLRREISPYFMYGAATVDRAREIIKEELRLDLVLRGLVVVGDIKTDVQLLLFCPENKTITARCYAEPFSDKD